MRDMRIIAVLLLLPLLLVGCVAQPEKAQVKTENQSYPITVVDDFNFSVTIEKKPERIVSLAPSNTENLFAIGVGDKVVAVTDFCNYPPEVKNITKIGGFTTIDIEKVVSLNPDLVVASEGNGQQNVETLKNLGLTVVAFSPKSIDDIKKNVLLLGRITGEEENASKLVNFIDEKIASSRNEFERKPKVVHILWHEPIWVSGSGTFIDEIISIVGGENVFSDLKGWKAVSKEDIISKNPDIVLVSSGSGMGGEGNATYEFVVSELDIDAVKEGRVYIIDADLISRPSYRIVYAAENISDILRQFSAEER
jgi:iron complex transport system substrate-binding protein